RSEYRGQHLGEYAGGRGVVPAYQPGEGRVDTDAHRDASPRLERRRSRGCSGAHPGGAGAVRGGPVPGGDAVMGAPIRHWRGQVKYFASDIGDWRCTEDV